MLSLPVRGAWVEMRYALPSGYKQGGSLPVRGAWVEIAVTIRAGSTSSSLPVRGAWVEITSSRRHVFMRGVAPRAGSVG